MIMFILGIFMVSEDSKVTCEAFGGMRGKQENARCFVCIMLCSSFIIFLFILLPNCPISQYSLLHTNIGFIVADSVVSFKTGAQYHAF